MSTIDMTRTKLFSAVKEGAILHLDRQKKQATLDRPSLDQRELVDYRSAAAWVDHLHKMARRAGSGGDSRGMPSTDLSRIVETGKNGETNILSDQHTAGL